MLWTFKNAYYMPIINFVSVTICIRKFKIKIDFNPDTQLQMYNLSNNVYAQ